METLEQLEERYFLLKMQDNWTSADYKYADELREKIRILEEKEKSILEKLGITIEAKGKYGEMTLEQIEAKKLIVKYFEGSKLNV